MLMGLYRSQKRFSEAVATYRLCEQVMECDIQYGAIFRNEI